MTQTTTWRKEAWTNNNNKEVCIFPKVAKLTRVDCKVKKLNVIPASSSWSTSKQWIPFLISEKYVQQYLFCAFQSLPLFLPFSWQKVQKRFTIAFFLGLGKRLAQSLPGFMPKTGLQVIGSWFLTWHLSYYIKVALFKALP